MGCCQPTSLPLAQPELLLLLEEISKSPTHQGNGARVATTSVEMFFGNGNLQERGLAEARGCLSPSTLLTRGRNYFSFLSFISRVAPSSSSHSFEEKNSSGIVQGYGWGWREPGGVKMLQQVLTLPLKCKYPPWSKTSLNSACPSLLSVSDPPTWDPSSFPEGKPPRLH